MPVEEKRSAVADLVGERNTTSECWPCVPTALLRML